VKSGGFRVETARGRPVELTLFGEHDLDTAPELRRRVDRLIGSGEPAVIDLSHATFVDSSILGVLLDARRQAAEADVGLAIALDGGSVAVARVLRITGLDSELPVHDSIETARAAALVSRVA
jgi:anti-sigma B factor antagonist